MEIHNLNHFRQLLSLSEIRQSSFYFKRAFSFMTVSDQLFFVDAFIGTKYEDQNCCRLEIAILKGSYHFICDAGL